jgi:hypothetical protein
MSSVVTCVSHVSLLYAGKGGYAPEGGVDCFVFQRGVLQRVERPSTLNVVVANFGVWSSDQ